METSIWTHLSLLVIIILYIIFLVRISGKERIARKLGIAFIAILLIGLVFHMILFGKVTGLGFCDLFSPWAIFWFSLECTIQMFFTNSIIFKDGAIDILKTYPLLFYIYLPLYIMAVLTSVSAVFHIFSRRGYTWLWLKRNCKYASEGNTRIFFGNNSASEALVDSLKGNGKVIYIDLPEDDDIPHSFSIWDTLSRLVTNRDIKVVNENIVILKAGKNNRNMRNLTLWLDCPKNDVYIISDDEARNLRILEEISHFRCHIYCHAKKEGLVNLYDTFGDALDHLNFIDSSYLAVESMKREPSGAFLPVKYVDIAKNDKGEKLGYVTSPFNCAVIGFGETGQEALKFLYEFGSFPDKGQNKSPFRCHVFDNIDRSHIFENYRDVNVLDIKPWEEFPKEVENHVCDVDGPKFWGEIQGLITTLNYIVVSLGNDELNFKIALDIAELAVINGRDLSDKFIIAVSQRSICQLRQRTLANANKAYHNCIKIFGLTEKIWTEGNIKYNDMEASAKRFFESYESLANPGEDIPTRWKARKTDLRSEDCEKRFKASRGIAQDYSNCLHIKTKLELCSLTDAKAAETIFTDYDENSKDAQHATSEHYSVLEYLAVCEHLRWNSSHLALGYKHTDGDKQEVRKLHPDIKAYSLLTEKTKHYDWLVVKNSFINHTEPQEYTPDPADLSNIMLPKQLDGLMEKMAENVHEVWAKNRMDQGWTLGEKRDDEKKTHPCLVPYSELPEVEKDYDRDTATSTLKFIIKSGYKIRKVCRFKDLLKKKN